jgi:hypothetical protein
MGNMISEEHNKEFHWKSKLDELDNVTGESFNKAASWNKLHGRLRGIAGKKKVIWYWAAASLLFFIIIIPLLMPRTLETKVVKTKKPAMNPNEIILKPAIYDKNILVKINNNVSPAKEKDKALLNKTYQKNHVAVLNEVVKEIESREKNDNDLAIQTTVNSLQPIDSISSTVIHLAQKKKLPVVHINELGDPITAEPVMARNSDRHSFQMKFGNQEVFINPSVVSGESGIINLKTSTSPN